MSDKSELLPCPFDCGSSSRPEITTDGYGHWAVFCPNCPASTNESASKDGAIALWNRRAAPVVDEAMVRAYWLGWRNCAGWADRPDLLADEGSRAYQKERDDDLGTLAAALAKPKGEGAP